MKALKALCAIALALGVLAGCGPTDVTEQSYDDAMKERGAKAKAITDKEGTTQPDSSAAISQDPQAGAAKTPSTPTSEK